MIKLYIAVKGVSQASVAKSIGIHKVTLGRLLQGKDVSMKSFGKLVKWLTEDVA